ncbi:MAG: tetratricopeptide repeat protein [bacterium]
MMKVVIVLFSIVLGAFAQDVFKGQMLEQGGQFEQAWKVYRTALERNPKDQQALWGLIRTSRQLGMLDSLLLILERIETETPENPDVVLGKVEALLGLKRKRVVMEQARKFNQKWPGRLIDLVETLIRGGEKDHAARYLEEVLKGSGFRVDYAEKLMEIYEMQGRFELAAEELVNIINLEPHRFNKFLERFSRYGKNNGFKEVMKALNKLTDEGHRVKAQAEVMLGAGNEIGAVRIVQQGLNTNEKEQIAQRWEKKDALRAALAIYQELGLNVDAARVLRKLGRFDEALALLAGDTSAAARFEYAEFARLEKRNWEIAAKAYLDVLRKRPEDKLALYGLAAALVGLKKLDSAQEVLSKISSPDDKTLYLRAKIFFYQGKFDSTKVVVREINDRFPQSLLVNDALEFAIFALQGERALELSAAMLDFDTGAGEISLERVKGLIRGDDVVSQLSFVFLSEMLSREGRYRDAVAVLDTFLIRFPKNELIPRVLFAQAEIYRQGLKDKRRLQETVERLMLEFPGSPYTHLVRNLIREKKTTFEPGEIR